MILKKIVCHLLCESSSFYFFVKPCKSFMIVFQVLFTFHVNIYIKNKHSCQTISWVLGTFILVIVFFLNSIMQLLFTTNINLWITGEKQKCNTQAAVETRAASVKDMRSSESGWIFQMKEDGMRN